MKNNNKLNNIITLYVLTVVCCDNGSIHFMQTFTSMDVDELQKKGEKYMRNYCIENGIPLIDRTDNEDYHTDRYEKVKVDNTARSNTADSEMVITLAKIDVSCNINIEATIEAKENN